MHDMTYVSYEGCCVAAQWLISYVASNVYIQDKPLGQCNFDCAWLYSYVASYITNNA